MLKPERHIPTDDEVLIIVIGGGLAIAAVLIGVFLLISWLFT